MAYDDSATVHYDAKTLYVTQDGLRPHSWVCMEDGQTVATGWQVKALVRYFNISAKGDAYWLAPLLPDRGFELKMDDAVLGAIKRQGLHYDATIDCSSVAMSLQFFAFCLSIFAWRETFRNVA